MRHGWTAWVGCAFAAALCACVQAHEPTQVDETAAAQTRLCASVEIRTEHDLRAAQDCREIDGNLIIAPRQLERVRLAKLRRVRGSLIAVIPNGLRELELP